MLRRQDFLFLFLTFAALYLATSGGRLYVNDSYIKLQTARALVDRGSLSIRAHGQLTVVSPKDGQSYAKFAILHSLLFAPACAAGGWMLSAGWIDAAERPYVDGTLASLWSPLLAALGVALFYLTARSAGGPRRGALLAAILFGAGTMIWPYSKRGWTEIPQLTLLLGATWALLDSRRTRPMARLFLSGILLGGVVALRITGVVLLPLFFLVLLLPRQWTPSLFKRLAVVVCGILLVAIPLVAFANLYRFGSVLSLYTWRSGGFTTPFWKGLWGLLVSPGESFFLYSPLILFACIGYRKLWRADIPAAILSFGVPVTLILLYSSWWFHAYTWGPRFLLPAIPFSLLPLAFLFREIRPAWKRGLVGAIVVVSVTIQLLGTLYHLGGLDELSAPLIRAGWLAPDRIVTREQTWTDPNLTRLASHSLVFLENLADPFDRRPGGAPLDIWPRTLRDQFKLPMGVSLVLESALVIGVLAGAIRLRKCWRSAHEEDQGAGRV